MIADSRLKFNSQDWIKFDLIAIVPLQILQEEHLGENLHFNSDIHEVLKCYKFPSSELSSFQL